VCDVVRDVVCDVRCVRCEVCVCVNVCRREHAMSVYMCTSGVYCHHTCATVAGGYWREDVRVLCVQGCVRRGGGNTMTHFQTATWPTEEVSTTVSPRTLSMLTPLTAS